MDIKHNVYAGFQHYDVKTAAGTNFHVLYILKSIINQNVKNIENEDA